MKIAPFLSFTFVGLLGITNASSQSFTNGNIVVYRVGDGQNALSNVATPVFLDEFDPNGNLVQSFPLPTEVVGNNRRLTASGSAVSEGMMTLSENGQFLVLTGYDAELGTPALSSTLAADVPRVIGRIDALGNTSISTILSHPDDNGSPRSVASEDGQSFWVVGATGGVRYVTLDGGMYTQISTTISNIRQVHVSNGQLYVSSGVSDLQLGQVGDDLPTTSNQVINSLPGIPILDSPYGFFFADLSKEVSGEDVLYVADDQNNSIYKFSLVENSWVANGAISVTSVRGLIGKKEGSKITLYATTSGITNGGAIYFFSDQTGYNQEVTGSALLLVTAPSFTTFRGIAFAPACVLPTLELRSSRSSPICLGTEVLFNADLTPSTLSPVYQWKINSLNVGTNNPTFSTSSLETSDAVLVHVSFSEDCYTDKTLSSTPMVFVVNPTNVWTGAVNENWALPANWGCGQLPAASEDAIIPEGASFYPHISDTTNAAARHVSIGPTGRLTIENTGSLQVFGNWSDSGVFVPNQGSVIFSGTGTQQISSTTLEGGLESFFNLKIKMGSETNLESGSSLHILPNGTATVDGILDLNHQSFVLRSNKNGTARLAELTGTLMNEENFTIQRAISKHRRSRYLSSPVQNAALTQWQDSMRIFGPLSGGFDSPYIPDASIKHYTEELEGWFSETNVTTTLRLGIGYSVFVGGKRTTQYPDSEVVILSLKGIPNTGPVSLPVTFSSLGWNLVGNPYPSQISWDAPSWTKTNVQNAVYQWDPLIGHAGGYFSYVNGIASDGRANGGVIASSQGFFVKAIATPVLSVDEQVKVGQEHTPNFKQEPLSLLRVKLSAATSYDHAVLYEQNDASSHFDPLLEAEKLENQDLNVYFHSQGIHYSILAQPNLLDSFFVSLEIRSTWQGKHQFSFPTFLDSLHSLFLIDRYLNTFTPIHRGSIYPFEMQSDSSTFSKRFYLTNISQDIITEFFPAFATEKEISISPNPIQHTVSIKATEGTTIKEIMVVSAEGNVVAEEEVNASEWVLKGRAELPSGIYLLKIITTKGECKRTVVKL